MAKKDGKKKTPGTRNDNRKNGKAFSTKKFDNRGRALTGRGKPSGRSVKGNRVQKFGEAPRIKPKSTAVKIKEMVERELDVIFGKVA
jgi:hypothetical protein